MARQIQEASETCAGKMPDLAGLLKRYYQSQPVRERMLEFLRGTDFDNATALYVACSDGFSGFELAPPASLPRYLGAGLEIDRSLWDRDSLIIHLDLEYHNFDNPAAPWQNPERAFRLQQPILEATLQVLGKAAIVPLILVSGRGFHLVWAIHRDSKAFCRLAGLGYVPPSLQARYTQPCSPDGVSVDPDVGKAFAGLGLFMEYVWHRVLTAAGIDATLPVQPVAIEVGPGAHDREIVAFDISEYGDPLHTRHIRLPFSAYLKPRQFEWLLGEQEIWRLLPIFEIPLSRMTPLEAIVVARDPDAVLELSRNASATIPDASEVMHKLLDEYQGSELGMFHVKFHRQLAQHEDLLLDPGSVRTPDVPGCVQCLIENPNDLLLKPAELQHVVRVLMALGWTPPSVARLIYATYLKDSNWDDIWTRLDPCDRAIFYTRLFAGMIVTGSDPLIDFNCISHQEKGYCMIPDCHSNLLAYREMLLSQKRDQRNAAGTAR